MNNEELSYQRLLRGEFEARVRKNPRYSLRAFSKFLEMEPAQLSRVLNGKQQISPSKALRIADLIFKSARDRKLFVGLVEVATTKSVSHKRQAMENILRVGSRDAAGSLELESLRVISDWYHIAILDLTSLDGFVATPSRVASRLGISVSEAKLAVDRLKSLELLVVGDDGRLKKASAKLRTHTNVRSEALKTFHKQMIGKAAESLDEQPTENRYVVGKTFALNKADLPRLRELVEEFRSQVSELLESSPAPKNSLYQLNVQLFELTKKGNEK